MGTNGLTWLLLSCLLILSFFFFFRARVIKKSIEETSDFSVDDFEKQLDNGLYGVATLLSAFFVGVATLNTQLTKVNLHNELDSLSKVCFVFGGFFFLFFLFSFFLDKAGYK